LKSQADSLKVRQGVKMVVIYRDEKKASKDRFCEVSIKEWRAQQFSGQVTVETWCWYSTVGDMECSAADCGVGWLRSAGGGERGKLICCLLPYFSAGMERDRVNLTRRMKWCNLLQPEKKPRVLLEGGLLEVEDIDKF